MTQRPLTNCHNPHCKALSSKRQGAIGPDKTWFSCWCICSSSSKSWRLWLCFQPLSKLPQPISICCGSLLAIFEALISKYVFTRLGSSQIFLWNGFDSLEKIVRVALKTLAKGTKETPLILLSKVVGFSLHLSLQLTEPTAATAVPVE